MSLWTVDQPRRSLTEAERATFTEALERIPQDEFERRWAEAQPELEKRLKPFRTKVTTQTLLQVVD